MTLRPPSSISLPRRWILSSRTFRLGLLVTAFFSWLTVDSFLYHTAYRTIHRGSLRDWSNESVIPSGTPDESGSFTAQLGFGVIYLSWSDQIGQSSSYYGTDERVRLTAKDPIYWAPRIFWEKDSVMRYRAIRIPTWLILLVWLGIWSFFLIKSAKRHRSFLLLATSGD